MVNIFEFSKKKEIVDHDTVKLFYLHYSCNKVVEKLSKANLNVIKNNLPNKSENRESLKKHLQQLERFSANVHIVGKDFLRVF